MKGPRPFGFRREGEHLVLDPDESAVRRTVFELFVKHHRAKTVARQLNEAGHRTRRGKRFSDTSVLRMLRDRSALEGIVETETWERCQALLADRAEAVNRPSRRCAHYLGEVVECACGGQMRLRGEGPGTKFICRTCRAKIPVGTLDRLIRESFRDGALEVSEMAEGPASGGQEVPRGPFRQLYSVWPALTDDVKGEFVALLVAHVVVGNDEVTVEFRVSPVSPTETEPVNQEMLPTHLDLHSPGKGATRRGNELLDGDALFSIDEVAAALNLSRSKVYELVASRRLQAFRPGGRIRVPAKAVREFLRDSRV